MPELFNCDIQTASFFAGQINAVESDAEKEREKLKKPAQNNRVTTEQRLQK